MNATEQDKLSSILSKTIQRRNRERFEEQWRSIFIDFKRRHQQRLTDGNFQSDNTEVIHQIKLGD